ncbi:Trihelix transcription factor GT-3b [Heracleum sosnowskyi]|uniref:Trihelix transcription factor GT-3b n=1 Tax=Heracleum sosnowskyi TaxID=360622 RepID=A0AAD8N670_9APIA|nr:Trihelix transcription factor GT-3b [Heracleum sosnowskyi]
MDASYHLLQQQQQIYYNPQQQISVSVDAGDDRFPQWSIQETRDFLMIRAEYDQKFMETKRNKLLWELISTKMKELGYNRSPDQCKCKWKNLVTRYKGCETMGTEEMRQQFPFYNELQSIFGARMQRMLWMEAEGGASGSKMKVTQLSSDEDDENEDSEIADKKAGKGKKKRKAKCSTSNTNNNNVKEMLDDFMKQQKEMEMQWMQAMEAREEERKMRELEWRQRMEALETERIVMEKKWREREEEWRMREEARAQKRDVLIDTLLNKLIREDDS